MHCRYCGFQIGADEGEIVDACDGCLDEIERSARDDQDAEGDAARRALEQSAPFVLYADLDVSDPDARDLR